jgi:proliferating cell nuclear antigen
MSDAADAVVDRDEVASGIVQADVMELFVDTCRAIVDEAKVHFDEEGIHATFVDPANAAMESVDLSKHAFESWDSPGQVTIGVNLSRLDNLLGSAAADDLVELGVDMKTRTLNLRYRAIEHDMALIDPDSIRSEPDVPDMELPNYVEIQSDDLDEAIENAELVSDHVRFDAEHDPERFVFLAEGDTDTMRATYDEDMVDRLEAAETVGSLFSIDYVEALVDPIPDGVRVGVEFGEDFPTLWEWSAFDDDLTVNVSLAPRIDTS